VARQIDFSAMSDEDISYIKQRPWIAEEVLAAGFVLEANAKASEVPEVKAEEEEQETPEQPAEPRQTTFDEVVEEEEPIDYASWPMKELREECRERDMPAYGSRKDLVGRLEQNEGGVGSD